MRTNDSWKCDVRYDGICKDDAVVAWLCPVEQVEISACRPCNEAWRNAARTNSYLAQRCPRCAKSEKARVNTSPVVVPIKPLTGIVARALENAMFAEGILIDARTRVLKRLAVEEAWLGGWGENTETEVAPPASEPGRDAAEESSDSVSGAVRRDGSHVRTARTSVRM
jgi:hypothetical protein